jgi:hypothetical protein
MNVPAHKNWLVRRQSNYHEMIYYGMICVIHFSCGFRFGFDVALGALTF